MTEKEVRKLAENKQIFEKKTEKSQIVLQASVYPKERKATSVPKREGESDKNYFFALMDREKF